MPEIVRLPRRKRPPAGQPYLVFEWMEAGRFAIIREPDGVRYRIGPSKHHFWSVEAPFLAERMNLDRLYYVGEPAPGDAPARLPGNPRR